MAFVQLGQIRVVASSAACGVMILLFSACKAEPKEQAEPAAASARANTPVELEVGSSAPEVTLQLHDGKRVSLASLRGKPVVVYFYPKDDTRGCTIEAQGIRDAYAEFEKAGARVFGVSTQGPDSHREFIDKHDLPFDLVVDSKGTVAEAFGVPLKRGLAARQTFVIDRQGKIVKIWREVQVDDHAQEILAVLSKE